MDTDGAERGPSASVVKTPVAADGGRHGPPPPVVDAEFRVIHPWRLWRRFRDSWWALGPYLAYCTALWGLAALVGWLMDHARAG
jgi:hypothetical protein